MESQSVVSSLLAVSFPLSNLESSQPSWFIGSSVSTPCWPAFPKATETGRRKLRMIHNILLTLKYCNIWPKWSSVEVWRTAALVISCSGETVGAQTIIFQWPENIRWVYPSFFFFLFLSVLTGFFFLPLSQVLLDLTEVIWENPWKVLPEFAEEIHLSESQFKMFFNLKGKNNMLNQKNWRSREKVALLLWCVRAC